MQDFRYALRMAMRNPAFSFAIVLTLALGIGANCAIFSVLNVVLIRKLPYPEPNRIVQLSEGNASKGIDRGLVSVPDYADWKQQDLPFKQIAAWNFQYFNLSGVDQPERVQGLRVSAGYFDILGVHAALGRTFLKEDDEPGKDRVVILSDGLWRRRFGANVNVVGRSINFEGEPYTVVGVLPRDFHLFRVLNRDLDVWVPYPLNANRADRSMRVLFVYARLRDDVRLNQAQAAMDVIAARLARQFPETNAGWTIQAVPLPRQWTEQVRPILVLLQVAVGLVLLIATANVTNLLLARGATRRKEFAIRLAVGAERTRLVRQLLTETLLLSAAGGIFGVLLAKALIEILNRVPFSAVNRLAAFEIDATVLTFSAGISIATGLLAGLTPAWQSSTRDLRPRPSRVRQAIVISEVAMATVLLIASGMMIRSSLLMETMHRGLDLRNLLTMQLWLPRARYTGGQQIRRFYDLVLERAASVSGLRSSAAVNFPPLSPLWTSVGVRVSGQTPTPPGEEPQALYWIVSPQYFRTMRIPLLQGRPFTSHDDDEKQGVVIVSSSFARRFWPEQEAIGKSVQPLFPTANYYWLPHSANRPLTVVGVAGDIRRDGLQQSALPQMYLPFRQNPSSFMHLVVETEGDPLAWASVLKREIESIDKDEPVFDIKTMEEVFAESFARPNLIKSLLASFAAVSLLLAGLGIYGVVAYFVSQRTSEIGLRMALGAERGDLMRFVVWQGLGPVLFGLGIGLAGTLAAGGLLQSLLFGLSPADPVTFSGVIVVLLAMALLATWVPALRATRVDPTTALRHE